MYLLDQKADDLLSKITFAQHVINGIEAPDDVLASYTEPLQTWTNSLRNRVEQAKAEFALFTQASHFSQSESIQESHREEISVIKELLGLLQIIKDLQKEEQSVSEVSTSQD